MIDTTIAHYKVTEKIGQGGMGEVYRATDTKLNRDVALKLLPEEFCCDPQRMGRFKREAEVLASLNHPHIGAIYGLEESEDRTALVLELVEGSTLQDRIGKGPIPVEDTLKIALQITEGLEAAHEQGVIHRDLKPANIKITPGGQVKILDFGLAKAPEGDPTSPDLSESPTLSIQATQAGMIMGTAAYMSPEQARGENVDKRADIWAFGSVLFEMLTGRVTFDGKTVSDVLAGVLARDPNWNDLPPNLHPRIQLLLERCLEKEPKDRYHGISDARVDIQKVLADPDGVLVKPVAASVQTTPPSKLPWVAGFLGLLVGAIVMTIYWMGQIPRPHPSPVRRSSLNLLKGDGSSFLPLDMHLAMDPAGSILAVRGLGSGGPQLFVRRLDSTETVPIVGTQGILSVPAISPDAAWVAFHDGQRLQKISLGGGTPVVLHVFSEDIFGIAWSGTDSILFGGPEGISKISAAGGTPELITRVDAEAGELDHRWPWATPDGNILAYTAWAGPGENNLLRLRSLQTGAERTLMAGESGRLTPTGHLVFMRGATLWAAPINRETLEPLAQAVPVLDGINNHVHGYNAFDLTDDGTLVYSERLERASPPEFLSGDGRLLAQVGEEFEGVHHGPPRLSPDGRFLALCRHPLGGSDQIVVHDLERGTFIPVDNSGDSRHPVWTPDGKRLTFFSTRGGTQDLYEVDAAGGAAPKLLLNREGNQAPLSWSPDGEVLAFLDDSSGGGDIWLLPRDGEPSLLLGHPTAIESDAAFSPDGRLLAFASNESGRGEVYVQDYPNPGRRIPVSNNGGRSPVWGRGSDKLYYEALGENNRIFIFEAAVVTDGRLIEVGVPQRVLQANLPVADRGVFDVASDGQSFVVLTDEQVRPGVLEVVTNWFEELNRLVPTGN